MSRAAAETFYLSKDVSDFVKKLSQLKLQWERELVSILLNKKLGEGDKISKIRELLPEKNRGDVDREDASVVLDLLPKAIRGRSRILLRHLMRYAKLGDGDVVQLPGVGPTAPLIDVLKFFASPRHYRVPLPEQTPRLAKFFIDRKFPASAFGSGVMDVIKSLVTAEDASEIVQNEDIDPFPANNNRWINL